MSWLALNTATSNAVSVIIGQRVLGSTSPSTAIVKTSPI